MTIICGKYGKVAQLAEHMSIMYVMQTAITFSHKEKLMVRIHPLPLPRLSVTENRRNMYVFFTANNFIGSNPVGAIMWCLQQLFWI